MANYKRKRCRRQVKGTGHRWRGNASGRFEEREEFRRKLAVLDGELDTSAKSTKRKWSRNKKIRSYTAKLAHLCNVVRPRFAAYHEHHLTPWSKRCLRDIDKSIEKYGSALDKLQNNRMEPEFGPCERGRVG
jgi:hypothetical protein